MVETMTNIEMLISDVVDKYKVQPEAATVKVFLVLRALDDADPSVPSRAEQADRTGHIPIDVAAVVWAKIADEWEATPGTRVTP